jgi:hypothetical protein
MRPSELPPEMNIMTKHPLLTAGILVSLYSGVFAQQQTPPQPIDLLGNRPDKETSTNPIALGEPFQSIAAGIALRPPQGGKMVRRPGSAEIVRFVYEKANSVLTVTSTSLPRPTSLSTADLPNAPDAGILEMAAAEMTRVHPEAQIVRQDTTNLDEQGVGMLAARYLIGETSFLVQQALIQGTEQSFYTVTYITPGAKVGTPLDAPLDPTEVSAVETFSTVLDTVKLLDRTEIKLDQDQRLYRTRALYVNLSQAKLEKLLIAEQWFRMVKNGRDIGYLYTIEEPSTIGNEPAIRIGMRSRTFDEKQRRIDAEAWLSVTGDRKQERWSRVSYVTDEGKALPSTTEIGTSNLSTKVVADLGSDNRLTIGEKAGMKLVDDYALNVKFPQASGKMESVERSVPPWYIPQALGQLLPRIVPRNEPKGYLFASFVPERREVMSRYVDVKPMRNFTFGGKTVRVTPIEDKIGLDGFVTTHYVSTEDVYLGSETVYTDAENVENKIAFIASTADELKKLWDGANLTRPTDAPLEDSAEKDR